MARVRPRWPRRTANPTVSRWPDGRSSCTDDLWVAWESNPQPTVCKVRRSRWSGVCWIDAKLLGEVAEHGLGTLEADGGESRTVPPVSPRWVILTSRRLWVRAPPARRYDRGRPVDLFAQAVSSRPSSSESTARRHRQINLAEPIMGVDPSPFTGPHQMQYILDSDHLQEVLCVAQRSVHIAGVGNVASRALPARPTNGV
jgi:hypothetical protein